MDLNSFFLHNSSDYSNNNNASSLSTKYLTEDDSLFPLPNGLLDQSNTDLPLPPTEIHNTANAVFFPSDEIYSPDFYYSLPATNDQNIENSLYDIDQPSADNASHVPSNMFTPLCNNHWRNTDISSPLTNRLNAANAADAFLSQTNVSKSLCDNHSLPATNFQKTESSPSLVDRNTDISSPLTNHLHATNAFLSQINASKSLCDNHFLPATSFQDDENSMTLLDHPNAGEELFLPNDSVGFLNSNHSLSWKDLFNAENSSSSIDSLNRERSLQKTDNINTSYLLPSTYCLDTQNSPSSTNLLDQSNSLNHVRKVSVNFLGLDVPNLLTQDNPPELQFGTDFSFFTNDRDERLSTSSMPIISNYGTSFGEEPNRSDLRRHTIVELVPSQLCQTINLANSNSSFNVDFQANSRTNIKSYLSEYDLIPGSLIKNKMPETLIKYSWTDIGQIREWESFSLEEFNKIDRLQYLLEKDLSKSSLPTPSIRSSTSDHNGEYFAAKINTALSQFQRHRYLKMRTHIDKKTNEEIFLSSYDGYTSPDGKEGRIVGLRKDLNGWDLIWSKNASRLKLKLDYLDSLAQLHYYLREYGCRYGYILTDVNLVVVRHGIEKTPNFGFLETKIFPLNPFQRPSNNSDDEASECLDPFMMKGPVQEGPALLALWYLHMLAGDITVPGHAAWDIDTGSYSDRSRHSFLARDADLLKILDADVRRAKRNKGWTAPWQIKAPRSTRRRLIKASSTPSENPTPKVMASERDPTRGIIKNKSEAVSKRMLEKPFKNAKS